MTKVDEYTLSCYLDGSLPYERACEVAELINSEKEHGEATLQLLKSHVLLKSLSNDIQEELVPEQLSSSLRGTKRGGFYIFKQHLIPTLQTAAAVVLILTAFFTGRMSFDTQSTDIATTSLFPELPAALTSTVNQVLEYQTSGTIYSWAEEENLISAKVTPMKSFKDKQGNYYRYYQIDLKKENSNTRFAGFAHRIDKEKWQTKSLFTQNNTKKTYL